jgi:hypothetical protein
MGIRDFLVWEACPIRKCPAADHPGLVLIGLLAEAGGFCFTSKSGIAPALRRFTKYAGGLPKRRAVRDGPAWRSSRMNTRVFLDEPGVADMHTTLYPPRRRV